MRYTSVYELYKTKTISVKELRNGHGSGPAIWDYISEKFMGEKFPMFDESKSKHFWGLYKYARLSEHERVVLLSTYDDSFIEVDNLPEFALSCEIVSKLIIEKTRWDWNHFSDIGRVADDVSKNHDYRCIGICIGCTSVSDEWDYYKKGARAWGIYSEINGLQLTSTNSV